MQKLNYSSLLTKRYELATAAFCRNERTKARFIFVLEKIINKFIKDPRNQMFILFKTIKLYSQLCEGKNYQVTKCVTVRNWNNKIKLILSHGSSSSLSSSKFEMVLTFYLCKLKYDLNYHSASRNCRDLCIKKMNCAYFKKSNVKFRYPKNGETLRITIDFWRQIYEKKYIMKVQIMDAGFIPLAAISLRLRGNNVEKNALYMQWQNDGKERGYLGYTNGSLIIQTFKKNQLQKDTSNFNFLKYFSNFNWDYIFKSH